MLKSIVLVAVLAGVAAGLAATLLHAAKLWPLIAAAERYEQGVAVPTPEGTSSLPQLDLSAGDAARIALTLLFNTLTGVGFALVLNGAAFIGAAIGQIEALDIGTGALWGLAGYVCFALAPALGLPPELPGMAVAGLLERQAWWVLTALATAIALILLVFARRLRMKWLGLAVLVAPHIIGAPAPSGVGAIPAELAAAFAAASLASAALFWLVLGGVSGWLHRRLM